MSNKAAGSEPKFFKEVKHTFSDQEEELLEEVNAKIGGLGSIEEVVDYLYEATADLCGGDRIGIAFLDESGERLVSRYTKAGYEPILLKPGFSRELAGSSLETVIKEGHVRIIDDLQAYLEAHPDSDSSRLLVKEGVRSSMTCPLRVDDRRVGVLFRSSSSVAEFDERRVAMHLALAQRMGQAVEKAYRIEQLDNANRAYMELLGFVVHELKSPLASMVSGANLLLGGYLGELEEPQSEQLNRMVKSADYLLGLIGDYLNLARMEGGGLEPSKVPETSLMDVVVLPALDLLEADIKDKDLTLKRLIPDEPLLLSIDPDLVKIAVVNFLSNAVKYSDPGGEITMSLEMKEEKVRFAVKNTGPGFSPEQKGALFRRFSRIRSKELMKRKGSGVGLYTTAQIVRNHGGTVGAESSPGQWALFWFEIPTS